MPYKEAANRLDALLKGKIPPPLAIEEESDENLKNLAVTVNSFIDFMADIRDFIIPLSQGELKNITVKRNNFLASPFRELHSRLRHLTWQAEQVAKGDYSPRVEFMGEFSAAFNTMIEALDRNEKVLKSKIIELQDALSRVRKLESLLPICSYCKRIRIQGGTPEDPRDWHRIETYITERTSTQFSHSICPTCLEEHFPDLPDNSDADTRA